MAIIILKRGTPKGEKIYISTCRECGTKFSYLGRDAKFNYAIDQRDGDYLSIDCPVCKANVTTTP